MIYSLPDELPKGDALNQVAVLHLRRVRIRVIAPLYFKERALAGRSASGCHLSGVFLRIRGCRARLANRFSVIGTDPQRYRPLILVAALVEKLGFGIPCSSPLSSGAAQPGDAGRWVSRSRDGGALLYPVAAAGQATATLTLTPDIWDIIDHQWPRLPFNSTP